MNLIIDHCGEPTPSALTDAVAAEITFVSVDSVETVVFSIIEDVMLPPDGIFMAKRKVNGNPPSTS